MLIYFSDTEEEISFAIYEENAALTKKTLSFLSHVYGKVFEEVSDDIYDEYNFEKDTLIIKSNFFNEDIFDVLEHSVDIHIVK
jgi:hypothetical protein